MTTLTYDTSTKAKPVIIGFVRKVAAVPVDFTVACLWAITGLMVTVLVVACVGSVDFASFLGAAG